MKNLKKVVFVATTLLFTTLTWSYLDKARPVEADATVKGISPNLSKLRQFNINGVKPGMSRNDIEIRFAGRTQLEHRKTPRGWEFFGTRNRGDVLDGGTMIRFSDDNQVVAVRGSNLFFDRRLVAGRKRDGTVFEDRTQLSFSSHSVYYKGLRVRMYCEPLLLVQENQNGEPSQFLLGSSDVIDL